MTKGKKLLRNTLLYSLTTFSSKALVFFMIPFYTHYFSTAEYGLWDVVITTIALLSPLITFELTAATYRWLLDEHTFDKRQEIISTGAQMIMRNVFFFNLLSVSLLFLVNFPHGWLILILINIDIVSAFLQQCARGLKYNTLFALLSIIHTVIMIGLTLCFIFIFKLRVEALFYAAIIAGLTVVITAWGNMRFHQFLSFKFTSKPMKRSFLKYALPMVPSAASWWFMTMADRYFIMLFLGIEANGIFAIAHKVPAVLLMLNMVFFLAWNDSAIMEYSEEDQNEYYSIVFKHFFRLLATSVLCLMVFAKPVISLVIADHFFEAWKYVSILLISALFHALSLFWTSGFHGAKQTQFIFSSAVVGAIINIVSNLIFIPLFGLYGVALASLIAFFIVWVLRVKASKPYFQIYMNRKDMVLLFSLMLGVAFLPFVWTSTIMVLSMSLSIVFFLLYNKQAFQYGYTTLLGMVKQLRTEMN